ncbi:unnamed protein product [Gordionus sp. m RMFG-2023]
MSNTFYNAYNNIKASTNNTIGNSSLIPINYIAPNLVIPYQTYTTYPLTPNYPTQYPLKNYNNFHIYSDYNHFNKGSNKRIKTTDLHNNNTLKNIEAKYFDLSIFEDPWLIIKK